MPTLVANCPRCKVNDHTFDILGANYFHSDSGIEGLEAFSVCRHCYKSVVFELIPYSYSGNNLQASTLLKIVGDVNRYYNIIDYINLTHTIPTPPPEHLPEEVKKVFIEATKCHSIGCWNAAGAMFRATIEVTTKKLLDANNELPKTKENLAQRLEYLFDKKLIPLGLKDLSTCIRKDGNDAVHAVSLTKIDADDLLDFTTELLVSLYTQPKKIQLAEERRNKRRSEGE